MNVLLLGSGGREHALAWKLAQSKHLDQLFIAPGNPGTAACGTNVNLNVNDFESIRDFVWTQNIQMVVVGPEEPLVNGIWDFFKADPVLASIPVIGPSQAGAQLEGSKAFSKAFMSRHNIPTARYAEFGAHELEAAKAWIAQMPPPYVLKADGLAAGKGVIITSDQDEAFKNLNAMLNGSAFGKAGQRLVIESFLKGIEVSMFVLTDGSSYIILPEAKDYKRIGNG
ncbi:MAG: phosphoribosylamine--glycine ligase, partial [Bacteroidia bacterium]